MFLIVLPLKPYILIQGVPKKCPGHIWYVNDNLIYAHLHRLPHVGFATFFLLVLNLREVHDVSVHKLNYHWHTKYDRDIFLGHCILCSYKKNVYTVYFGKKII